MMSKKYSDHLCICSLLLPSGNSLPPGFSPDLSNFHLSSLAFLCHFFSPLHMLGKPFQITLFKLLQPPPYIPQKQPVQSNIPTVTFYKFLFLLFILNCSISFPPQGHHNLDQKFIINRLQKIS